MRLFRLFSKWKSDVGIVMPVYIQEPSYLRKALRSILEQSYENFRLVIVVDGAPSDTVQIIREETKKDKRAEIVIKTKNEGVSKALNTGFARLMKRPWVQYLTWVSSDNVYYPNFIEELRKALKQAPPNVGLVYSSFREIDANGKYIRDEDFLVYFRRYLSQPKEQLINTNIIGVSFMYKKKFAAMTNGYWNLIDDYEYWLRLTQFCDIEFVPKELMDYRAQAPHSISAKIHGSTDQHRRWRYVFNLLRQQMRFRKGITYETTIIFPVRTASKTVMERLDDLLEQYYSNFRLWLIDISPDASASAMLKNIEDPRIIRLALSGDEYRAAAYVLPRVETPYTMIYNPEHDRWNYSVLSNMVQVLSKYPGQPLSVYLLNLPDQFLLRAAGPQPMFRDLYNTQTLLDMYRIKLPV